MPMHLLAVAGLLFVAAAISAAIVLPEMAGAPSTSVSVRLERTPAVAFTVPSGIGGRLAVGDTIGLGTGTQGEGHVLRGRILELTPQFDSREPGQFQVLAVILAAESEEFSPKERLLLLEVAGEDTEPRWLDRVRRDLR